MSVDIITMHKWEMVTWHVSVFLQSKMPHRACEMRGYSWFLILLFLTYSHTFLLGLGGPSWQWGAVWFALSIGQGELPMLQVAHYSHILSKSEHNPSRTSQTWQAGTDYNRPSQATPQFCVQLFSFLVFICFTFLKCWLAQQASGVGVPNVPGWWCLLGMLQGTKAVSCIVL